jgi:regulator of sirC expression with transglutaminase-like and TPR domain
MNDGFFADSRSVFLHGLLGPERVGTCSSLPVLYVAIGRQLGYPLKLVTTRGHLFVRWEGAGERFNIEATGHGLNRFDDEYYRHWPFEVSKAEESAEGYLKSLTPPEELGVFLSIRGMCLRDLGRQAETADAFAIASRLAPDCRSYRQMLLSLQSKQPPVQLANKPNL